MKNLIKSDLYQLKRNRLVWVIFAVLLFLVILQAVMGILIPNEPYSDGGQFLAMTASAVVSFGMLFTLLFTAVICGEGFKDKTFNYNIMSGHKRNEILFSRMLISLVGGVLGGILLVLIHFCIVCMMLPMDSVIITDYLFRVMIMIFPLIRLSVEMLFISFIVKNELLSMVIGVVFFYVGMLFGELFPNISADGRYILGILNISKVFTYDTSMRYELSSVKEILMVHYGMDSQVIIKTVVISLIVAIIFTGLSVLLLKDEDFS